MPLSPCRAMKFRRCSVANLPRWARPRQARTSLGRSHARVCTNRAFARRRGGFHRERRSPLATVALPTTRRNAGSGPRRAGGTPRDHGRTCPGRRSYITEEKNERRRLNVFSASARRKRAAGHLKQVEKRHAHDPHPGVTGQLEYDHPVSYEVAVAKKPQMILNSEVMGDEQPVPP